MVAVCEPSFIFWKWVLYHIFSHLFSLSLQADEEGTQLVGISCFLANKYHGYLYDIHQNTKLVSSFSFMAKSYAISCDNNFIHALSSNSVESYTTRMFQAAVTSMPLAGSQIPTVVGGEGDGNGEREEGERGEREGEEREEEKGEERETGCIVELESCKDWLKQVSICYVFVPDIVIMTS